MSGGVGDQPTSMLPVMAPTAKMAKAFALLPTRNSCTDGASIGASFAGRSDASVDVGVVKGGQRSRRERQVMNRDRG